MADWMVTGCRFMGPVNMVEQADGGDCHDSQGGECTSSTSGLNFVPHIHVLQGNSFDGGWLIIEEK